MNLQVQGGKHDTVETKDIDKSAPVLFKKLSEFFFIINSWGELFWNATTFQVTDQEGQNKFEKIEVGDLVKIKIPGPKSKVGHGYDWVQIVEISEDMNSALASLMISVKPC